MVMMKWGEKRPVYRFEPKRECRHPNKGTCDLCDNDTCRCCDAVVIVKTSPVVFSHLQICNACVELNKLASNNLKTIKENEAQMAQEEFLYVIRSVDKENCVTDWCLVSTEETAKRICEEWKNKEYEKSCDGPADKKWLEKELSAVDIFTYAPIKFSGKVSELTKHTPLIVTNHFNGDVSVNVLVSPATTLGEPYSCFLNAICLEDIVNGFSP